jgi:hypothetical protein
MSKVKTCPSKTLTFNKPISITPSSTHIMYLNVLILTGSAWNVSVRLTEYTEMSTLSGYVCQIRASSVELCCRCDKIEKNYMGGACSAYAGEKRFWWRNLRERHRLGNSGVDGRIMFRWIFRKWDVGVWIGSSWLRIGTGGGHL